MLSKKNKTRKVVSNTVACNNFTVNGAENIFERQSFVTESKQDVFLDATICQLGGGITPARAKLSTSGKKECASFS